MGWRQLLLGWRQLPLGCKRPLLLGWRPLLLGLEAIATRLEAIAIRLEAIAIRLEAIAISWRPLLFGWRPLLLGWRPLQLGWRPVLVEKEAIAFRLEAIASRLEEAIAIRLEAIASSHPGSGLHAAVADPLRKGSRLSLGISDAMDEDSRVAPGAAREILRGYSLWGDAGGWLDDRPSLLVDRLTLKRFDDLFLWEADHLTASGRGLKYLDVDSVWVGPDDLMPQSITFDWKADDKSALHNMCIQGIDGKCMIWNAALNFPGPNTRGYLSIDNETLLLPLKKADDGPIHILHLFGGSFGGWSFATQLLNEMEVNVVSGSIEVDFHAARSYALSHRCPLLSAARELPPLALYSFKEGWCIHGDVMDCNWMQAVACWAPEIITISAPCPPWSGASSQKGLHTTEGQLFMRSIGLCNSASSQDYPD